MRRLKLGVLISGGGTTLMNLQHCIQSGELDAEISIVIASRPDCAGLEKARQAGIPCDVLERRQFRSREDYSAELFSRCRNISVDLVLLAGFLVWLKIPTDYQNRVMNIHPSLLPAFGGRGMYGLHVHQAVLDRGCKVSGCTVHFVDDEYDHGPIILQRPVPVLEHDTAETLAARVFEQECRTYPEAIRLYAAGQLQVEGLRVRIIDTPEFNGA